MNDRKEWYVRMSDGNVYGPADVASLVSWAEDGRIDPSSSLSKDRIKWTPAQLILPVVQWLRICLAMQEIRVQSLVKELRSHMLRGAAKK